MGNKVGNIVFAYLFRWDKLSIYNDEKVDAASVEIAFHVYKNGKEIMLDAEPEAYTDIYFSDICKVCYDSEAGYVVEKNENIAELFKILDGYEEITFEVIGYTFESHKPLPQEKIWKGAPAEYRYEAAANDIPVAEDIFKKFLVSHCNEHKFICGAEAKVSSARIINLTEERIAL